ncbi:MAG TPA: SMC family ATPase [Candidatus Latescibacteria bacterium]|nr:SMC family ATPase [Candidatus Latescibacterota bacterium]
MVPVRLHLRNFMSYGENVPVLDFTGFRVACLSGRNGHGKSALLDAITWALWGRARGGTYDEVLRVGTSEMQVTFEFELEGNLYRVIRTYRRAGRGGLSSLEFQLFDPKSGGYKPLSSQVRRTQEEIVRRLRMDYDTFINSAFVLQGRADEFTRKTPRERKEVLARILGLSKYEELEALAKEHVKEREKELAQLEAQLKGMEEELAHKEEYERELGGLSAELEVLGRRMGGMREERERLEGMREGLEAKRRRLGGIEEERRRLKGHIRELSGRISAQERRAKEYEEVLAHREEILKAFARYEELGREERVWTERLQAVRGLETRRGELEKEVEAERHGLERKREGLSARKKELEARVQEAESVLFKEAQIEEGCRRLEEARREAREWEERRARHEELDRRRTELLRRIEEARAELSVRLGNLEGRIRELEKRAEMELALREEVKGLEGEVRQLEELERERDNIRDRGTQLKLRIEAERKQTKELEGEITKAKEKLSLLQTSREARCPLCRVELDVTRRRNILTEYATELKHLQEELGRRRREIREMDEERGRLRARYKEVDEAVRALPDKRRELARVQAAYGEAIRARGELERLRKDAEALRRNIEAEDFAQAERRGLAEAEAGLRDVGYDPEGYRRALWRAEELARFEVERERLEAARTGKEGALQELEGVEAELRDVERRLAEGTYAEEAQRELEDVLRRVSEVGYDGARHREVQEELDRLRGAPARRERLLQAEVGIEEVRGGLEGLRESIDQAEEHLKELEEEAARLEGELAEYGKVEERLSKLGKELEELQARRDELLGREGAVRAQYERCLRIEEKAKALREKLTKAQKERTIYEKLQVALGRDGIQALIIEGVLPELEEEANETLKKLTDGRAYVRIEPLRERGGKVKETLDIRISDELGTRDYGMFSGGEAFRVDFALRIALSKLLARRAGTRLRMLVIDEGFGTQDAEGLELLVEAINTISVDFDKILVVTHLEQLRNAFPVRIEVEKRPDIGSTFQVIGV